jgi:hypothetical protein
MTYDLFVLVYASSKEDSNMISAVISNMFKLPTAVVIKA